MLDGTWAGILYQDVGGTHPRFNYEISITSTSETSFSGTSKISVIGAAQYFAIFNLVGTQTASGWTIQEHAFVENRPEPGTFWCTKIATAIIEGDRLTGDWTAPGCAPGSLELQKSAATIRWFERLPDCPCHFRADLDGQVAANKVGVIGQWNLSGHGLQSYHPGAVNAIRWVPTGGGSGQQCTYDASDALITSGLGAGTPDFVSSEDSVWLHYIEDVVSFEGNTLLDLIMGQQDFGVFTCAQYFEVYPPNQGSQCVANPVNVPNRQAAATRSCRSLIDALSTR